MGGLQCYRSLFSLSMLALFCWCSNQRKHRRHRCKRSGATAPECTYGNKGDNVLLHMQGDMLHPNEA